jgi:hypothetical protein
MRCLEILLVTGEAGLPRVLLGDAPQEAGVDHRDGYPCRPSPGRSSRRETVAGRRPPARSRGTHPMLW